MPDRLFPVQIEMDLHKYNEPCFPPPMRRYGCRFSCLRAVAEVYVGRALTEDQIMETYHKAELDHEVMGKNCLMRRNEHLVINWAFRALGRPDLRGAQVGRMKGDRPVYWNRVVPFQYIIGHWHTTGPDGHWTLFDADGREIWDGYDPRYSETGHEISKLALDKRLLYYVWEV